MRSFTSLLSIAVATASIANAQTYTDCNPTNVTCTPDTGLATWSFTSNFTKGASELEANWTIADGTTLTYDSTKGAVFNISKEGQAPTISSNFYLFFGRVEVVARAAPGTGIVSSIVLESDDLDEIDWEWLGGDNTEVETNYFGKGNTTSYDRATYETVETPTDEFHTYVVDWTKEKLEWIIDGSTVRTLEYADANGGDNYPQTPMMIKLGNWCGGCSGESEGTIEWAGGNTTFDDAPYLFYVKSVQVVNYNPASSYNWTDKTGSYESIDASNSTSVETNLNSTSSSAAASTTVYTSTKSNGDVTTVTSTSSATSTGSSSNSSSTSSSSFSQSTSTSDSVAGSSVVATWTVAALALAISCLLL